MKSGTPPDDERREFEPIYREALKVFAQRRLEELGLSMEKAAKQPGRSESSGHRYLQGKEFPRSLAALAPGLGLSRRDLETELILTSAELLGLDFVELGREERDPEEDAPFVYWQASREVLRELHRVLGMSQKDCAKRAGLTASSWGAYVHGRHVPARNLPKIARGLGIEVGELERRIVLRSLEKLGFSSAVRVLKPGPCWAFGGVLLDDGRMLVVDTFQRQVWEYSRQGVGRRLEALGGAVANPKRILRSPGGALWMFGDGNLLEIDSELQPLRSYAVWGRRDEAGCLLETIDQWSLMDDETVVGLTFPREEIWVVRLVLTSGEAGRFEILERQAPRGRLDKRFFSEGSPKIAVAGEDVYWMRLEEEETQVRHLASDEVVASYPGGRRVMRETGKVVGDWFVGLCALGLVAVEGEILVLRRHGRRFWLEDLEGRRRLRPRRSHAMRVAPVVGKRVVGLMELMGERVVGDRPAGLLWMSAMRSPAGKCGSAGHSPKEES